MLDRLIKESGEYKSFVTRERDNLSHAYLVLGADTAVRQIYIKMLAENILCGEKGCGECRVCQKVWAESHPDIKVLNKEEKVKVDDIEKFIDDVYLKPWESDIKLYFIDNAENLNPAVQNKLLKIYEEPPKSVVIFLLAGSQGMLLPTIVSRAKKIYLPSFSPKQIYDELVGEGYPARTAETASALSGGRFDRAYLFASDEGHSALYEACFDTLLKCKTSKDIPLFTGKAMFSKENLPATLDILEVILYDVMGIVSGSGNPLAAHNREYDLREISKGFSPGGAAMALLSLNKARRMLASYVSAAGIADTILFGILEAKYKWQ